MDKNDILKYKGQDVVLTYSFSKQHNPRNGCLHLNLYEGKIKDIQEGCVVFDGPGYIDHSGIRQEGSHWAIPADSVKTISKVSDIEEVVDSLTKGDVTPWTYTFSTFPINFERDIFKIVKSVNARDAYRKAIRDENGNIYFNAPLHIEEMIDQFNEVHK